MPSTQAVIDFELPSELEAHEPPEARGLTRDAVRLLVSYLSTDRIVHARFTDLPSFLRRDDLLVVNISATLPAALAARRGDGTEVMMHVSTRLPAGLVVVEFRKVDVSAGEVIALPGGGSAVALVPYPGSARLWVARLDLPEPMLSYLERWGRPIAYPYVRGRWPIEMYQNVYASVPGSAEMPSAGRPFTPQIIDQLTLDGVRLASVILHAGVGSLERDEPPYEEYFEVPHETAVAVQRAKEAAGRVGGVGTSVGRALESSVEAAGRRAASRGCTDLISTAHRGVQVVDGLGAAAHEPEAAPRGPLA